MNIELLRTKVREVLTRHTENVPYYFGDSEVHDCKMIDVDETENLEQLINELVNVLKDGKEI